MEPLHISLLTPSILKNKTVRRFHYEEQREIRQWYKTNRNDLSDIRDNPHYCYKGLFVQTESRSSSSKSASKKKSNSGKKSNKVSKFSNSKRSSDMSSSGQTTVNLDEKGEDEDEDAIEANSVIEPLRFRGLYTRNLYDLLGRLKPKYQSNTKEFKGFSADNFSDIERSSDSDEENFYSPAFEINENNSESLLGVDSQEISTFHLLKDQKSRISKNLSNPELLGDSLRRKKQDLLFRCELSGIESLPQPLKVGKIRRESPRVQMLMKSLSSTTLQFLSKNRSRNDFKNKNIPTADYNHFKLPREDDVFINFHSCAKLNNNSGQKITEAVTAKQMVANILCKSILDKKYELARRALGIYVRHDDSDMRLVYSAALKILDYRKTEKRSNVLNQNGDIENGDVNEISEDEELIRWMIVAYPSMIEYFQLSRSFPKNIEYAQLYVMKMLYKPEPRGYNEAIDYLDDLLRKAPYLDEPVFYLLRAFANTQKAYDENADTSERLKAIDSIQNDYQNVHELGGEGFYPKDLITLQRKNIGKLQKSLVNDEESN
ncbi:uncharacterized protein SAPINGB_P003887 [Magnusiomyces paraingens]|uniref:Uncharacterized protein n=1 Tax=Magnusiomyces paraingens TaxID=2606893 RepID=A0A5E8BSQ8_9ASCO|nr:uncharacterized protein SAPINGB_P003887 [Saprochaete ingens]VVT54061.1 unnamed protein product [Saprochaete ingens]